MILKFRHPQNQHRLAKFDLTLDIYSHSNTLSLEWEFANELFETQTIEHLSRSFEHLLTQLVTNSNKEIRSLALLDHDYADTLMSDWQGMTRDYAHFSTLPSALMTNMAHNSQNIAVEDIHHTVNYSQLTQLITQYSNAIKALNLSDHAIVGVCCGRSIEMLAMMIAIWNNGHAYLPLDPSYPQARLRYMLEDTQSPLVLCDHSNYDYARALHKNVHICDTLPVTQKQVFNHATPAQTAYVIYTSGSTGKPKGVMITHASLLNFVASMAEMLTLNSQTRALAITSISFDIHILELFAPLFCGGYVYVATTEQSKDPQQLQHIISEHRLNLIQATPTTWKMLHQYNVKLNPNSCALSGGEPLNKELLAYFFSQSVSLWNMYGPTETTVWSSMTRLTPRCEIHLGKPIANTQFYVVNAQHQLVPRGTSGELLIAGGGLASGYLNRSEESKSKFIELALPNGETTRAYKTGDLVKLNKHNRLLCLGRIDQQVKLNGFRIELI